MRDIFKLQFCNGAWTPSTSNKFIAVENPATRVLFTEIPAGTIEDVDRAVRAAREALPAWSATTLSERISVLERMLKIFIDMSEEVVALETAELGAPVAFARKKHCDYQMRRTAAFIEAAKRLTLEEAYPKSLVTREPVGVVAAITPWNYPLGQIVQKVMPALLAGCTVVLKPSSVTPLTACLLVEAFREAGLPAGVLNLVNGRGETLGRYLAQHPGIDMLSFTGSTAVGRELAVLAASSFKRLTLELGGKSPCVWLSGVSDWRPAAKKLFDSLLLNAGQTCTALSRLIVPEEDFENVKRVLLEVLENYPMGDPQDPTTRVGPVVSRKQFDFVKHYIELGLEEGAELLTGGVPKEPAPGEGYFIAPTIFTGVKPGMRIEQEEIFGPVLCVLTYRDEDEAVKIANDTPYGLCGAVWGPRERAIAVAKRIRSGNVYVNDAERDLAAPFGGFKASGLGREGGLAGILEFTELKAIFEHSTF